MKTRKYWGAAIVVLALAGMAVLPNRQQPRPGAAVEVSATAYCDIGKTKSGTNARRGIVAADPRVLPVGSVVRVEGLAPRHNGIYTVMDTGSAVKGRVIDIFMADCRAAERFGRQTAEVRVIRVGWDPKAIDPRPPS